MATTTTITTPDNINLTIPKLNDYDLTIIAQQLLNFNIDNGLLASGGYQNSQIIQSTIESVYGSIQVNDASYRAILFETLKTYLNETGQFVILNDLANNNSYVAETLRSETDRVDGVKEKTINTTYKQQHEFFQKKYIVKYNQFVKNIVKYLILLSIFIMVVTSYFLKGVVSKFIFTLIVSISSVLSFLVILVYVKNVQTRRKDDWDKYYFSSMNTNDSGSCGNT